MDVMEETAVVTTVKPKNNGQKRIFDNPLLEKLTRTHIAVPIAIFFIFSASLLYYGIAHTLIAPATAAGLFLAGLLVFSFIEYWVHRNVFHMVTNTVLKTKIQYNFHGVHHEYPKDKGRLAMPPLVSITLATGLFFLFRLVIGNYAFGFLPGFMVGYAAYLGVHYIVHAFPPPTNFLKILWVNHGIHHYKDDHLAFGVSSPLWDWFFGTLPARSRNTK
jgi:sterol desaturase/sphingolipid hydroxylase (fatty acid hydroxylase superfamily)